MAYKTYYTQKADKQLSKLTASDINKVIQKIGKLTIPFPQNLDIRKMINAPDFYRMRCGKVRILFETDKKRKEIWIRMIKYRGSAYKKI